MTVGDLAGESFCPALDLLSDGFAMWLASSFQAFIVQFLLLARKSVFIFLWDP
jgi:hypothetical protein